MQHRLIAICCACLIVLGGCMQALKTSKPLASDQHIARGQLSLHCDFVCPERQRLMDELVMLRDELVEQLGLPESVAPIEVYLFEQEEVYYRFLEQRFPDFPARPALFVQTDARRTVYAHWGSHLLRDLRHEVTHATLHAILPDLPLWLDEGLAEYFEVGPGEGRLNQTHVEYLRNLAGAAGWQPDLLHLEGLQSARKMEHQDYAESWAWVHFLLQTDPNRRGLLLHYLTDLQGTQPAMPLSARLDESLEQAELALAAHVESMR
jgi:Protein of unknown function (DUF1570)